MERRGNLPFHGQYTFPIFSNVNILKNMGKVFDSRTPAELSAGSPRKLRFLVGAPGIEPGPYVPKTYILPIYYAPFDV